MTTKEEKKLYIKNVLLPQIEENKRKTKERIKKLEQARRELER